MECHDARTLLATRRDLSRVQRGELDAHLAGCRGCAAAQVAEARTSRALQQLPASVATPPPRVAAALARNGRRRRSIQTLHTSLALAAVAAVLVLMLGNIWRAGSATSSAVTPGSAPPQLPQPLIYLAHSADGDELILSALGAEDGRLAFSLSLGAARGALAELALAPDGARLYMIARDGDGREALVARDTASGAELWRTPFVVAAPFYIETDRLSVAPDGARIYLRGIDTAPRPIGMMGQLTLRTFDAASGVELAPIPTDDISAEARLVLPLADGGVLLGEAGGPVTRIGPDMPQLPGAWVSDEPTASAARLAEAQRAVEAHFDYRRQNIVPIEARDAGLAPDGRTVFLLGADLSLFELAIGEDGVTVGREVPRTLAEKFFFDRSVFAANGAAVAAALERRDLDSGELRTDLRVLDTATGQVAYSFTLNRRLGALALSPAGDTLYLAYSTRPSYQLDPGMAIPTPDPAPQRTVVLAIDLASGEQRVITEIEGSAVGLLAGR